MILLGRPRNLSVTVLGGHPRSRRLAQRELTRFYRRLARRVPQTRIEVTVPSDLDDAVRATLARSRNVKSGFIATGRHGTTTAVTIPIPSEDGLSFAILIHPLEFGLKAFLFSEVRRRTYAHEEGHVMDFMSAYPILRDEHLFDAANSVHAFFLEAAFDLATEYRAESWKIEDELREHHGHVRPISRYVPSFEAEIEGLAAALGELPAWLVFINGFFRKGLPFGEFMRSVLPRLREVLTLTAYMCAREDVLRTEYPWLERLRPRTDLVFYFRFLDAVRPHLRSMAKITPRYDVAELEWVADLLSPFFRATGLDFKDDQGTLKVLVNAPQLGG